MTEPGAGSDLRGMKTKAVKDGNDWVINGESLHYGTRNPSFFHRGLVRGDSWITSKFRFVTSTGRLTYGKIYFSNWGHWVYR